MPSVVLITGASSGFGNLAARALSRAGHIVYAGMRETSGRNADAVADLAAFAAADDLSLKAFDMDVQSQESVDHAVGQVLANSQLDVVIHNAGHMVFGPSEAFTVDQLTNVYDINVLSTQRVNRAVLPALRRQRSGLLLWVGSSSTRGGHPPFLGPYFAAKAAMDALAESYAAEIIKYGIETTILVPGAYPTGTNHFAHASTPDDQSRNDEYTAVYGPLIEGMTPELARIFPDGHGVDEVAQAIIDIVDTPIGQRPFRVHVDPSRDGSAVVTAVADRIRAEFYHRIGIGELLPATPSL